ncbi:hypothetical protein M3P21_18330 [Ruegeria sp. 2012CJ41-6]|uniref:Lipoprotein n=1 Tax=Ruegeria spongiae TaxID=2942209 RepID=A0ABT0Q6I8_9RHOB|nr:hypothetical protein [Ruegeria spongiae]MCL6285491.1 hypothetical protein [Ruegeria spongiae]
MNRFVIALGCLALAGCAELTDARTGQVHSYDGNTVVIRGPVASGQTSRPPVAMREMARDLCPDARYISSDAGGTGALYTFSCR